MNAVFAAAFALTLTIGLAAPTQAEMETVASFGPETPPGNLAIGPDGRMFMSLHGFYGQPGRVVEVHAGDRTTPYPGADWAEPPATTGAPGLHGVLGLTVDRQGILWLLDAAGPGYAGRLIGWDTQAETLHRVIYLAPPVIGADAFLNDLAVDRTHEAVYITDTASPETSALIVVDLSTGQARRVLVGSPFTRPEDRDMVIDGQPVRLGGGLARIGANPITVDPANRWVYFAPMTGHSLYRVRTVDLLDTSLSPAGLEARVERYGDKPISDGITVDGGGHVYITAITEDAIGVVHPDGSYEALYRRDDLSWPDGFAYGPDDFIYVAVNELHRSPVLNQGEDASRGEFQILRFPALVPGAPGR